MRRKAAREAARRWGTNWFSLLWLIYLSQPLLALFARPVPALERAGLLGLLAPYLLVYLWNFNLPRRRGGFERPLQWRSVVGTLASFAMAVAYWPAVGDTALTFLVYAASFAGFQTAWAFTFASLAAVLVASLALAARGLTSVESAVIISVIGVAIGAANTYFYRWNLAAHRLARAQEEVARAAKTAERERIARDLHDLLGHSLSVIVLKSELASRLAAQDPARAVREIRDVERLARDALAEVRSAVRGWRAPGGLRAELAGASLALEAAGVRLEQHTVPVELDPAIEEAVAMALREAVTNVVRHANATVCRVRLEPADGTLRLEVSDDGGGLSGPEGSGLNGMRHRAEALGGQVWLSGDGGTRLVVTLPLRPARAALARPPRPEGAP